MKHTGKDIKELLSDIPAMHCTPEIRIDCPDEIKKEIVKRIVAKFVGYKQNGNCPYNIKELNTVDGVRAVFEHGWGLIRASNTQPVAVMRVEAEDKASLDNYRILLEEEFKEAMKAE
jgi:phosphomannomutase/phosphoglucomutase